MSKPAISQACNTDIRESTEISTPLTNTFNIINNKFYFKNM